MILEVIFVKVEVQFAKPDPKSRVPYLDPYPDLYPDQQSDPYPDPQNCLDV
jgi:hypothetical protein